MDRMKMSKVYYQKHRERLLAKANEYNRIYPDRIREYVMAHKQEKSDYDKKYRELNRARIDKYIEEHREDRIKYAREYRKKNKAKLAEYRRNRIKNDPQYRIANTLRSSLKNALKNDKKVGSAVRDLGCSVPELKVYLEKQFSAGMSWDKLGQIHIDHKIPLSLFDLTDRTQFLKACHYTNLQPLWALDNYKKSNKITP